MSLKRKLKRIEDKIKIYREPRVIVITGFSEQEIEKQLQELKKTYGEDYLEEHEIIKVLFCKKSRVE